MKAKGSTSFNVGWVFDVLLLVGLAIVLYACWCIHWTIAVLLVGLGIGTIGAAGILAQSSPGPLPFPRILSMGPDADTGDLDPDDDED